MNKLFDHKLKQNSKANYYQALFYFPIIGTTRKANQTGLSPGDGVAIGLGCAIVVAIGFAVTRWCVKRRRQNHLRDVVVRFQEVSTSDNHAIEITDKQ